MNYPSDVIQTVSIVRLTEEEMQNIDNLVHSMNYECENAGWIPTMREVDEKLIGRYQAKVREKLEIASQEGDCRKKIQEIDAELKQMWTFMYWIVETCPEMSKDAYQKLSKFVDSKCEIVR